MRHKLVAALLGSGVGQDEVKAAVAEHDLDALGWFE
jgi:hypothetical protein